MKLFLQNRTQQVLPEDESTIIMMCALIMCIALGVFFTHLSSIRLVDADHDSLDPLDKVLHSDTENPHDGISSQNDRVPMRCCELACLFNARIPHGRCFEVVIREIWNVCITEIRKGWR